MKSKVLSILTIAVLAVGAAFAIDYNTQVRPSETGFKIGTAADQAIGFWGVTPVVQQTIAAITDNSGGATADGTIGAVTAPTAITDSTGGSSSATLAAITTFTPSVAWNGSSVYPSAADATAIAAAITSGKNSLASLATAQEADRVAIVALKDAVKELSTQVNLLRTKLINNGIVAAP